jgi:opacity protein-like surface antigen
MLALPSIAFSGDYYITAKGGFSDTDNVGTVTSKEPDVELLVYEDKDLGSGSTFGLSIGKHIIDNFRLELEVLKRNGYTFNAIPNGSARHFSTGDVESSSVFVNALYDFNAFTLDNKTITPYIGVGVGLSRNKSDRFIAFQDNERVHIDETNSTNELAYKFSAGMVVSLTESMFLDVGYQYVKLGDFESGNTYTDFDNNQTQNYITPIRGGEIDAHELIIGLRFNF